MLVVRDKKALVVNARDPEMVLACIPTAKTFKFRGKELLAVPHRLDEVRVLRNLGANAPSPINYYHEYPKKQGRFDPFEHQRKTAEFLTVNQRCAVLNQPRTGKTISCLWAFDYLRKQGKIRKVVIVAPLSTLDPVWATELYESFWWYKFVVLHGSRDKRLRLLKEEADVFIVNHHGFEIVAPDLPDDVDLVIYDEASVMRNPSTKMFKMFDAFVKNRPHLWLWLLTGTPTPNEPTDAWALCKLIGAKVPRYHAFRDMVMQKVTQWAWRPRPNAMEIVSEFLQPSILFRRADCFDQPPTMHETRKCELTADQKKSYADMLRRLQAEVGEEQITAVSEAAKIQKLLQILLGVIYTNDGGKISIDAGPRIAAIKEVIEETSEKVIVFVPFTGALHAIADALRQDYTVEVVYGDVSKSQRDQIFRNFSRTPDPRVIVADARTMSHGLDLSEATAIIWAGPTNSNDTYTQANDRIVGPKQKLPTSIIHIVATELEQRVFSRLKDRQTMQGILLDLVQQKGNY